MKSVKQPLPHTIGKQKQAASDEYNSFCAVQVMLWHAQHANQTYVHFFKIYLYKDYESLNL